eukprot:5136723-Pyramimonas_sp.AAC.1
MLRPKKKHLRARARQILASPSVKSPTRLAGIRRSASSSLEPEADFSTHGAVLKQTLLGLYLSGRLTSVMVVSLANLVTKAGGHGVEDIGRDLVHSRNSTRALKRSL